MDYSHYTTESLHDKLAAHGKKCWRYQCSQCQEIVVELTYRQNKDFQDKLAEEAMEIERGN